MASAIEQSVFFQKQKAKGVVIVTDPPKFDLESYISNYSGFTRIDRLHHVGSHSPYFAVDAYRLAIAEAKNGKNVEWYIALVDDFSNIAPQDAAALLDTTWAEKMTRESLQEKERLEQELKSYKNNLIKESIRMGNEDLGHFYFDTGNYSSAFKTYTKMREHCTSTKHLINMTLRLVFVTIVQKSWMAVQSNLIKLDAIQVKSEDKTKLEPIASACNGLAQMSLGNFEGAANYFLKTSPTYLTVEPVANITWQSEVLSPNDVAVYGGLCALAAMDRNDLQDKVLTNSEFRNFLELEPHIHRAINLFCNSKYSACLEILESYRKDYLLDVYLAKVLNTVYKKIRTKSIIQYFIPFSCVTLDEMTSKFPTSGYKIEDELGRMVRDGTLDARIDLVDRLLISPPTNPRHDVHTEALAMAEAYDHTMRLHLARLNMRAAGMQIRQDTDQNEKQSSVVGTDQDEKQSSVVGTDMGLGATWRDLGSKMGFTQQ